MPQFMQQSGEQRDELPDLNLQRELHQHDAGFRHEEYLVIDEGVFEPVQPRHARQDQRGYDDAYSAAEIGWKDIIMPENLGGAEAEGD